MEREINSSISLLSNIHSLSADFLIKGLSNKGLSDFMTSHGNILFQLSLSEKLCMSELATLINRDKSTTTVLVRKLEKEGLIFETPDESDKRSKYIQLTEKGKEYNSITAELSRKLLETFYKGFSKEEESLFVSFLERIKTNFNNQDSFI